MAKCDTKIEEISFDFTDDELTGVAVKVRATGDCPHTLQGMHREKFGASTSALDILNGPIASGEYLHWSP